MTDKKVSIIILNYNGWKDTIECLTSIYQVNYSPYDIILVDNASEDESLAKIRQFGNEGLGSHHAIEFQEYDGGEYLKKPERTSPGRAGGKNDKFRLILLKNDKNYGFAEGNNIAIRFALHHLKPDYLLFLNNDTVVDQKFIGILVEQGEQDDGIGILGPTVYDYNDPNRISVFGGFINLYTGVTSYPRRDELDTGQLPPTSKMDYISGCCLLIKRGVLEDIGMFNAHYFLYYEDTELCFRARSRGYKVVHVAMSQVWHKVSPLGISSTGIFYLTRNRFWFLRTYSPYFQFVSFLIFFFLFLFLFHAIRYLIHGNLKGLRSFYAGIKTGLLSPAI